MTTRSKDLVSVGWSVPLVLFGIVAAMSCHPGGDPPPDPPVEDPVDGVFAGPDWYQHAVFYQIWVRSYYDSDGDGIGDLRGITEKMDYIESLGVGALWLSPFYPTPYLDSGYDVADYRDVDPNYGTLEDLDELLAAAHQRGIRVVVDLVLNHTSSEHPWFIESRSSVDDPRRDWYLWAPEPDIPCETFDPDLFGEEAWTLDETTGEYYFHHFRAEQPDLDYSNPEVAAEMLDTARFWLERGADGFRVDAIQTLFEGPAAEGDEYLCEDHPLTHEYLQTLRSVLDEYPERTSIAEAWTSPESTAEYFGDGSNEFHMSFSEAVTIGMQAAIALGGPGAIPHTFETATDPLPPGAQLGLFLSNHDSPRIMSRVEDDPRRAKAAAVLLLTLPGTPFIYYGDELGMTAGTDVVVDGRDASRTPMQWSSGPACGFSEADPWLAPAGDCDEVNVASEQGDPDSLLNHHRQLLEIRNRLDVFGKGSFEVVPTDVSGQVLAYWRESDGRSALVLVSLSSSSEDVVLDLSGWQPDKLTLELVSGGGGEYDPGVSGLEVALNPYGYAIWSQPVTRR